MNRRYCSLEGPPRYGSIAVFSSATGNRVHTDATRGTLGGGSCREAEHRVRVRHVDRACSTSPQHAQVKDWSLVSGRVIKKHTISNYLLEVWRRTACGFSPSLKLRHIVVIQGDISRYRLAHQQIT